MDKDKDNLNGNLKSDATQNAEYERSALAMSEIMGWNLDDVHVLRVHSGRPVGFRPIPPNRRPRHRPVGRVARVRTNIRSRSSRRRSSGTSASRGDPPGDDDPPGSSKPGESARPSDAYLAARVRAGDERAFEALAGRYWRRIWAKTDRSGELTQRGIVPGIASSFYSPPDWDRDDLIQEGLIALRRAALDYRPERGASFETFARLCIKRGIIGATRRERAEGDRLKREPVNDPFFLDGPLDGPCEEGYLLDPENFDPADKIIAREELANRMARLSKLEREALALHVNGHSNEGAAELLEIKPRSVVNALQRARGKVAA